MLLDLEEYRNAERLARMWSLNPSTPSDLIMVEQEGVGVFFMVFAKIGFWIAILIIVYVTNFIAFSNL